MEKLKDTSKLFTVNKEAFEEIAAELKFFKNSEKVYKNYEKEVAKIEEQKAQLETELTRLMTEQVKLVKELELFKGDVSQVVYLRREMKNTVEEIEIVQQVLKEVEERFSELKVKYFPEFEEAMKKDNAEIQKIDFTPFVNNVLCEMLESVSIVGKEFAKQKVEADKFRQATWWDEAVNRKYINRPNMINSTYNYTSMRYDFPSYPSQVLANGTLRELERLTSGMSAFINKDN
ncbi:hypothetical protein [Bacillus toyonensis]|jgi:DNA repair ATPase RecN|uniref:hypothetical protein n=1 Tax=Bacillus toyonensis TaxID=155322 RepID=UPI000BF396C2|nr:hypothetical protein [Bacillus toyonensis]PGA10773.1 hypothetical protein COL67_04410 [Bacillus toyonensis]